MPSTKPRPVHLLRREPQITLGRIPGLPHDPVRRIPRLVLRPDPGHVVTEPRRRPRRAHPLRQHRRRHVGRVGQQATHPRLDQRKRRLNRSPLVLRWRFRPHRLDHRRPRDAQPPRDRRVRHLLRSEPPDQCPVLHSDHPSDGVGVSTFHRRNCSVFKRRRHHLR